jgi:hypothetical protein
MKDWFLLIVGALMSSVCFFIYIKRRIGTHKPIYNMGLVFSMFGLSALARLLGNEFVYNVCIISATIHLVKTALYIRWKTVILTSKAKAIRIAWLNIVAPLSIYTALFLSSWVFVELLTVFAFVSVPYYKIYRYLKVSMFLLALGRVGYTVGTFFGFEGVWIQRLGYPVFVSFISFFTVWVFILRNDPLYEQPTYTLKDLLGK